jgi:hypothetical protein
MASFTQEYTVSALKYAIPFHIQTFPTHHLQSFFQLHIHNYVTSAVDISPLNKIRNGKLVQ